jgi:AcrR family transcriptional regulator
MPTPERTSYAEIVATGREVLEESGPAGLTMQRIAEKVGVRAPSLYKRVRDREALVEAVATATVGI